MATSVGTMWVDIRYNSAGLAGDLRRQLGQAGAAAGDDVTTSFSTKLTQIGTSVGNLGRQVSLGLSLPLIAFGKQATDSFTEFDTAMTQVVTLSGVAQDTVSSWTDDVMDLGHTYGVAAGEAAQGLYFVTSSGIESSKAMEVLDVAAKSSALGLGTTATAADVVTSALNQYGEENLSAAEAADVLTVAVRDGKGEADDLAGALGKVIPIAGSMGVSFNEVAGVMSAMTISGTSADEAATQINALLTQLQKMPAANQRNMKALTGLDYATVQQTLHNQGLTETLRMVYNAFGDNDDAIGKVFGNVRALRGITNLFGEKEAQTERIVWDTTHAIGAQDDAMAKLAGSKAFQLRQAQADFSNAMTNIGGMVTPVVATVTSGFAKLLDLTKYLTPVGQGIAVFAATTAAAAGPMLYMGASVMRLAGNIGDLIGKLARTEAIQGVALRVMYLKDAMNEAAQGGSLWAKSMVGVAGSLGLVVAGVGTAVVAFTALNAIVHQNDEEFAKLGQKGQQKVAATDSWVGLNQEIDKANKGIAETNSEVDALHEQMMGEVWGIVDLGLTQRRNDAQQAGAAYYQMGQAAVRARDQALALSNQFGISRDAAAKWISTQSTAGKTFDTTQAAIDAYTKAQREGDQATKQATIDTEAQKNSLAGIIATTKETSDAFFGVINAQKQYEASQKAIADAKQKVVDAEKAHTDAMKGVADAQRKVADADEKVVESTQHVTDARQKLADAQQNLNTLLAGPSKSEQLDVRSAQLGVKEAQEGVRTAKTPLERERAQIALERARLDLADAQKAHDKAIADARNDVKSATDGVREAEKARQDAITAAAQARVDLQTARDKEHQSLVDIKTAQDNVSQAYIDAVTPAMNLTTAQQNLNTMFTTGTAESGRFRQYLIDLKDLYPELAGELQNYMDKYDQWEKEHPRTPTPPAPGQGEAPSALQQEEFRLRLKNRGRATGGPLAAGEISTVNERGIPELFTSGSRQFLLPIDSGTVVPLAKAEAPTEGPSLHVAAINVYGADEPVQTAYEIRRQLRAKRDLVGRR